MDKSFNASTTADIDAKLHRDIIVHENNMVKVLAFIVIVLTIIFRGWVIYWLKFGIAIPTGIDYKPINIQQGPTQTNYEPEVQKQKTFVYRSLINNHQMTVIPQAHYVLPARAVAYNHDFLFISEFFDSAALYDLGASWGKLSDKRTFKKYIKVFSTKTEMTGSRTLHWNWNSQVPFTVDYINSHISHSHLIPANRNIMAALLQIKVWDIVEIEGELVDMIYEKPGYYPRHYHTSLSRSDTNDTSRGNGACETVYVTKVKIGKKVYR